MDTWETAEKSHHEEVGITKYEKGAHETPERVFEGKIAEHQGTTTSVVVATRPRLLRNPCVCSVSAVHPSKKLAEEVRQESLGWAVFQI